MVYEWLGTKKVWGGKKEHSSEKYQEKKERKTGGYKEILQIFHITAMLLGILMEKISRVQAAGRNWAGTCVAYASARNGVGTCSSKVCHTVNKSGSGHAAADAGRNNMLRRINGKSGQALPPIKRIAGNKYRDRRLLRKIPETVSGTEAQNKNACYVHRSYYRDRDICRAEKNCRVREYPDPAALDRWICASIY